MKIAFFFRKPVSEYHSIEELFKTVVQHLPTDIQPVIHTMPFESTGIFKILFNSFKVIFNQCHVNHITGDIHYISFLLKKKKTILTIHDLEILKRKHGIRFRLIKYLWFTLPVRRVHCITVISEATRSELQKAIKVNAEKIKVIPNCLPGNMCYQPKPFNTQCPVIMQVGTKQNKNIPRLLAALEGIPCKMVILGKIPEDIVMLINQKGIPFENYYNLSYQQVTELYTTIDLLTFVSLEEGFGIPILEAQATGRPVITSNCSSMPEVAGDAAVLVDPYDVESIRQGILAVIRNQDLRDSLIKKGLENVKRFRPEKVAEEYASLYREIVVSCRS